MARVLRCDEGDFDPQAMTCAAPYWTEDTGMLPPLSSADALQISVAIAGAWALGFCIRQLRKAADRG